MLLDYGYITNPLPQDRIIEPAYPGDYLKRPLSPDFR